MALMKFIKSKWQVEVDPRTLMLVPFLDIWNSDQTENKEYANKMLCYIHLISQIDPIAPFYNSDPDEVVFLAKSQIFRNMEHLFTEEESILIDNAVEIYIKSNEVVEERLVRGYNDKIDEMRLELARKKFEIIKNSDKLTGKVTFSSNSKIITDTMEAIGDIIKVKLIIEDRLRSVKEGDKRIKGQRKPSFLEEKMIKLREDERAREEAAAEQQHQHQPGQPGGTGNQPGGEYTEFEPGGDSQSTQGRGQDISGLQTDG